MIRIFVACSYGPGGGQAGGRIVATGTPAQVAANAEQEGQARVVDSGRTKRPPTLDELGEFGFDVHGDEPEEVDVLAVAGGDERQQFVADVAALGAKLADRLAVGLGGPGVIWALVSRVRHHACSVWSWR
ncbi:hypothetical protein [Nonomuraea helvata]|uniref:Uncharacterized protein n=1 Tax=Nonomuraea helvata TaxID=37484 RepID=A0ABV5S7M0_9ACTN